MAVETNSASDFSSARGSRAPPTKARKSTRPSGARLGHFEDSHEAAMMPVFSILGTTNPDPFIGWETASRRKARATVAAEVYGISPHNCASAGLSVRRIVAAANAGAAR